MEASAGYVSHFGILVAIVVAFALGFIVGGGRGWKAGTLGRSFLFWKV